MLLHFRQVIKSSINPLLSSFSIYSIFPFPKISWIDKELLPAGNTELLLCTMDRDMGIYTFPSLWRTRYPSKLACSFDRGGANTSQHRRITPFYPCWNVCDISNITRPLSRNIIFRQSISYPRATTTNSWTIFISSKTFC